MATEVTRRLQRTDDPLDPRVAAELRRLRDNVVERLRRQLSRRRMLRRDAVLEAAVGLLGGLTVASALVFRVTAPWASLAVSGLALASCTLAAVDTRRIRELDAETRLLARALVRLS